MAPHRFSPVVPLLAALLAAVPAAAQVPEPEGYRLEDYRAPTPATLEGAAVVDAETLHRMIGAGPVTLVDVLPQPPRPENLPATTLWRPPARFDIPGSAWLANTGYGTLSDAAEQYFRTALEGLTLGDRARPIVFYCDAGCWMSWNAAKRALSYGYSRVYWFPGGVTEWMSQGYPALPNLPLPAE